MHVAIAPVRPLRRPLLRRRPACIAVRPDLATLADRWWKAVEEVYATNKAMHDELDRRREAGGAAYGEEAQHRDTIELQGPFEAADDRKYERHYLLRDALLATGTGAAIVGGSLYAVGPPNGRYEGGEVRRFDLADLFGE